MKYKYIGTTILVCYEGKKSIDVFPNDLVELKHIPTGFESKFELVTKNNKKHKEE